ncbi:hypothetical protein AB0G87_05670 [Streptomyces asoensis]|uniref:hypothetical protein n=1 Tax=Streptomyces asoensis TaxID=249586 RepID=UPI0033DF3ADD
MRSPTRARGRRGAVWGASAAAVVLAAGLFAGCGGDGRPSGYVAVGAAGDTAPPGVPGDPTGGVRLVPLDGASGPPGGSIGPGATTGRPAAGDTATDGTEAGARGSGAGSAHAPAAGTPGGRAAGGAGSGTAGGTGSSGTGGPSGGSPASPDAPGSPGPSGSASPRPTSPSGTPPAGPAALVVSDPVRAGTDQRWCEDVTLVFRNPGGTAVRSGTVAFGTHVIDALGIDWATRRSTVTLPVPIAAGGREERTWTVCVDAWRVPLGMHIETRDVSVDWK